MLEAIKSAENALKRANRYMKNGVEKDLAYTIVRNEYSDLKTIQHEVDLDYMERLCKIKLRIEKTFNI